MPIYEYRCRTCDKEFETLVFRADEKVSCPGCNGEEVERMMSRCAFKSGGEFTPATGSSSCGSCTATSCSTCGQ
jgi:putative FmdB family regulatory protein